MSRRKKRPHVNAPPPSPPLEWQDLNVTVRGLGRDLLEVTYPDGAVVRYVPQEAALRVLGQSDPIGRLIGAFVGEAFLTHAQPGGAKARGMKAGVELAYEHLRDQQANAILKQK